MVCRMTQKNFTKIERFLFRFLSKQIPVVVKKRELLLEKTLKEFGEINQDVFEKQILRIFDFTAWVESLLRKIPLSEILQNRMDGYQSQRIHN